MKNILLASAAILAFAAMPALADGPSMSMRDSHWYVGLSAGADKLGDFSVDTTGGNVLSAEFDTGYALMATVGYRWSQGLRLEAEAAYRDNKVRRVDDSGFSVTSLHGGISQFSLMANALYDIHLMDDVTLSLGAGIGAADADVDIEGFGDKLIVNDDSSSWSFSWQLIAGLSYAMSPNTEFFVEYHYLNNDDHDVITFPPPNNPLQDTMDVEDQTASFGVRFALGR